MAPSAPAEEAGRAPVPVRWLPITAAAGAAVFLSRAVFGDLEMDAGLLLVDAIWPALVFAAFLAMSFLAVWAAGARAAGGPWMRLALGAGAAAFLAHNLAEFSLWMPGVALAFWATAGLGLAFARDGGNASGEKTEQDHVRLPRALEIAARTASLATVLAVGALLWWPVFRKVALTQEAADRVQARDLAGAIGAAARAARADPLDDIVAADAARLIVAASPREGEAAAVAMGQARRWSQEAIRRNPRSASDEQLAANIESRAAGGPSTSALAHIRRAVALDPANARLRLEAARMLCEAGSFDKGVTYAECLLQLAAAEDINRRLTEFSLRYQSPEDQAKGEPPSKMVLNQRERAELARLKARAENGKRAETRPEAP